MSKLRNIVGFALVAMLAVTVFQGGIVPVGAPNATQSTSTPSGGNNVAASFTGGERAAEETSAYLFVHFIDTEENADKEQIYFSVSENGTDWKTLNNKAPILRSSVGLRGVRDPHIVRSPDGDKFYMIATDLSIYYLGKDVGNNERWGYSQTNGSQSIVIWESDDLVNWSAPRLRKIARDNAGCAWAPESIWDDEKNAYMVFWASRFFEGQDGTHRVYRCYTTDFDTFTEPELYIESDVSVIDTTFIKEGETYYRFTKNEAATYVYMEKCDSLSGDFEAVAGYRINGASGTATTGYEGPTIYKLNGVNKWCLLLDNYGNNAGYKPFVTENLAEGHFESADAFNFNGTKFRHGTVMPITQSEYDALVAAYPFETAKLTEHSDGDLLVQLDFDDKTDATVGKVAATGNFTYETGVNGGKALKLSANNFLTVTEDVFGNNPLRDLTSFTVSFAVKATSGWWFYAAPNTNGQTYRSEKYVGISGSNTGLSCERYNSNDNDRPAAATGGADTEWVHVTVVYRNGNTTLYINGEQKSQVDSSVNLPAMLGDKPILQIGKANWGSGEYADGLIDSFRLYNYAFADDKVAAEYKTVMGIE